MLFLAAVVLISVSNLVQAQNCGYVIQSGDTFYKLGGSNVGGMCAWLNANPGVDPCTLKVGACLNVPQPGYTSTYCPNNYNSYACFSGYAATGNYYGTGYYAGPTYGTNTGAYYPTGNTGAYYPTGNTGAYYPTGNTGAYYPTGNTGAYYPTGNTGAYYPTGNTGAYYPSGNTGGYYGGYSNPYGYGSGNYQCGSGQRTIQSGDSFWGLGGTQAGACAWMAANPGVDPCQLKVGYCLNPPNYSYSTYNANCVLPTCNNYGRK